MNNILDNVDAVVQYIILYGPTLVAVIGTIGTVIAAIKKVTKGTEENTAQTKLLRKEVGNINQALKNVLIENAELKKENAELKANMNKIYRGN